MEAADEFVREKAADLVANGEFDEEIWKMIETGKFDVAVMARAKKLKSQQLSFPTKAMNPCPKCGGEMIQTDRAVYTRTGEVDQDVYWVCQKCGTEL